MKEYIPLFLSKHFECIHVPASFLSQALHTISFLSLFLLLGRLISVYFSGIVFLILSAYSSINYLLSITEKYFYQHYPFGLNVNGPMT